MWPIKRTHNQWFFGWRRFFFFEIDQTYTNIESNSNKLFRCKNPSYVRYLNITAPGGDRFHVGGIEFYGTFDFPKLTVFCKRRRSMIQISFKYDSSIQKLQSAMLIEDESIATAKPTIKKELPVIHDEAKQGLSLKSSAFKVDKNPNSSSKNCIFSEKKTNNNERIKISLNNKMQDKTLTFPRGSFRYQREFNN